MEQKRVVASYVFNSQHFEQFRTGDKELSGSLDTYAIDGVGVSKEEWAQKQDEAIAADMIRLRAQRN